MSFNQIRFLVRYARKFFAGFICVIPFTSTKLSSYPFAHPINALNKDWLDIGNDIEKAKQNSKK
ncbi:MAG: hypothetical protein EBS06_00740 [Proteobacteria bacterium]|nr:hypothetical protein [Pseudomonadota bacterium]